MLKERRFRLMINEFQGQLLRRFIMYWVIYQFTLWNIMFFVQVLREGRGDIVDQYARFVASQYPMLICLIVLVPCFAWDAVKFSLRIAGPLHRIRQTMQAIEAGRTLRPVKLREGDYLQEVIDDLNSLIMFLEERNCVKLDSALQSHQSVPQSTAPSDVQDHSEPKLLSQAV